MNFLHSREELINETFAYSGYENPYGKFADDIVYPKISLKLDSFLSQHGLELLKTKIKVGNRKKVIYLVVKEFNKSNEVIYKTDPDDKRKLSEIAKAAVLKNNMSENLNTIFETNIIDLINQDFLNYNLLISFIKEDNPQITDTKLLFTVGSGDDNIFLLTQYKGINLINWYVSTSFGFSNTFTLRGSMELHTRTYNRLKNHILTAKENNEYDLDLF